ncbi:atlastin-1-like [Clavelina lepadiformis]|uniref:atlastin-1-like n=1 Tax=Clavelina lepadiformis TaxID=159417 RepID=UPI0040416EB5
MEPWKEFKKEFLQFVDFKREELLEKYSEKIPKKIAKFLEKTLRVPILIQNKDGSYEFDELAAWKIFNHEDVKNNPVLIISITGAMRKGKSFLLNLLIIFLESEMDNRCFSDDTKEIPQIFPWKKGQDRVTSGIWIWSKPYMITGQDDKKVAVLLMDTQGAFDKDSKNKTETDIFTLSSLLSTVQIYNVKDNIDENVLRPLSDLCNYALEVFRLSQNEHLDQNAKVLQNLTFLIRDFQDDEKYSFGTKGGKLYLNKQLSTSESNDPDVQVVRANISKTFNSLNCCLLPYPGVIIAGHKRIGRNVTFGGDRIS